MGQQFNATSVTERPIFVGNGSARLGYPLAMSSELLPDHWIVLHVGETISARLTPAQLDRAIRDAKRRGVIFKVEPAQHYWLTVVERLPAQADF